ncbi:MAG: hypothetical protein RID09_22550 [Coleofasciculus sp. G1-WW12-02]
MGSTYRFGNSVAIDGSNAIIGSDQHRDKRVEVTEIPSEFQKLHFD